MREKISRNKKLIILAAILIINTILKFSMIDSISIGHDEPLSITVALNSILEIPLRTDNNPPLFYFLLHYMVDWFGNEALVIRFIPCLFGVLLSGLIYVFGEKYLSHKVGFFAAILYTFSTVYHHHSHNARVYTMFAFLAVLSMYYFLSYINKKENNRSLQNLSIISIIMIYSHFFGLILLGFQGIFFLFFMKNTKKEIFAYIKYMSIVGLSFLPYIYILYLKFSRTMGIDTTIPETSLESLYIIIRQFSNKPAVAVVFLFLILASLIKILWKKQKVEINERIVFFWFFGIYIMLFFISFFVPMFISRYMVFIFIPFYYLVGLSIEKLFKDKNIQYSMFLISTLAMFITFQPTYHFYGTRRGTEDVFIQYIMNLF
jgi:mannosyltransferase